jgi:Zn-dependent protease with chaperone function
MDFFSQQDQARRSSKRLLLLFSLAVMLLIAITNILVAVTLWLLDEQLVGNYQAYQQAVQTLSYQSTRGLSDFFSWQRFGLICLAVCGVIGCAMLFKAAQLSAGGKRVAEQLGGHRIQPNTNDEAEKRLLNVVEEMAIASGMPVPAVYLLADEIGINAFAAGSTPADAVIGVTRGCLQQFSRPQLQGVIAHEFSHILNGDMRLNIRLIAILHGILFIGLIGELLMRSSHSRGLSSRKSNQSGFALLGLALLLIGWLGRFFGNWIKSAVSQQREYLADASAVQFTRDPQGISQALKIIGGYQPAAVLESDHASEMSHLFFGQAVGSLSRLFATHPPLETRIQRIDPHWDGQFIFRQPLPNTGPADTANVKSGHSTAANSDTFTDRQAATLEVIAGAGVAAGMLNQANSSNTGATGLSKALSEQIHDPFSAIAVLFALLLSDDPLIQQKQLEYIQLSNIPGLSTQSLHLLPELNALAESQRLPLIQLALPALKCMSAAQYKTVSRTLLLLIRADKQYDLFEWCLYQLVRHYLQPEFQPVKLRQAKYRTVESVSQPFAVVLSLLCHYGVQNEANEADITHAFNRGANTAGLYTLKLIDKQRCNMDSFIDATNTLTDCFPLLKPRLLKALTAAANHDNQITTVERELITAIAAVMDSPVPSLG